MMFQKRHFFFDIVYIMELGVWEVAKAMCGGRRGHSPMNSISDADDENWRIWQSRTAYCDADLAASIVDIIPVHPTEPRKKLVALFTLFLRYPPAYTWTLVRKSALVSAHGAPTENIKLLSRLKFQFEAHGHTLECIFVTSGVMEAIVISVREAEHDRAAEECSKNSKCRKPCFETAQDHRGRLPTLW